MHTAQGGIQQCHCSQVTKYPGQERSPLTNGPALMHTFFLAGEKWPCCIFSPRPGWIWPSWQTWPALCPGWAGETLPTLLTCSVTKSRAQQQPQPLFWHNLPYLTHFLQLITFLLLKRGNWIVVVSSFLTISTSSRTEKDSASPPLRPNTWCPPTCTLALSSDEIHPLLSWLKAISDSACLPPHTSVTQFDDQCLPG